MFRNDVTITSFLIFYNFFVASPILLKFCTEIFFVSQRKVKNFVEIKFSKIEKH